MRRSSSAPLLIVPIVILSIGAGFALLRGSEPPDPLDTAGDQAVAADNVELVAQNGEAGNLAAQPLPLPAPRTDLPAPTTPPETAPPETEPPSTNPPPETDSGSDTQDGGNGRDHSDHRGEDLADPGETHGYDVHAFTDHVTMTLGSQMLAPGQLPAAGYTWEDADTVIARAPITGLRPVIEQAISDVKEEAPDAEGRELEARIAKRLTELNDWDNLNRGTRWSMMLLSGVDIRSLSDEDREEHINHMLHSPLTFGTIEEVLTPDVEIEMGYTHTLDKDWTQVADLGNGVYQIFMVSNNNNGAHTAHVMGSFKVQLEPGTSLEEAREVGNRMVENDNNNDRLYLDPAAQAILYGQTPLLDYSNLTRDEARAMVEGRGLPEPGTGGHQHATGEPPATEPPAEQPPAEEPPAEATTTTTAPAPAPEGEGEGDGEHGDGHGDGEG